VDHHVAPNANLLVPAGIEHAEHDGSDRKDHNDLDRDGEGTDDGTQGTMDEIAEDEFIHSRRCRKRSLRERVP
jgi:hypothetical protein